MIRIMKLLVVVETGNLTDGVNKLFRGTFPVSLRPNLT